MAKVLLVAKCLACERKQLEKENLKWLKLHKEARALAQNNTTRIKDLLKENFEANKQYYHPGDHMQEPAG
jgi:hypothetical protein